MYPFGPCFSPGICPGVELQDCMFIGRIDAKAETPILWPPHEKSWLIGKDSDAGRDWGQEEKGTTEDEMAGWHHWLDGCESGWTPGVGDGQGGLACCDSWGRKESDMTEWSDLIWSDWINEWISHRVKENIFSSKHTLFLFVMIARILQIKIEFLVGFPQCPFVLRQILMEQNN